MIYILKLLLFSCIALDMYKDGYWKRAGKLLYWTKFVMYLCILLALYIASIYPYLLHDWHIYVSVFMAKKPISDFAYSYAYNPGEGIYIGQVHWSDKLLHNLGLVKLEKEKFPVLYILYTLLIFISFFL